MKITFAVLLLACLISSVINLHFVNGLDGDFLDFDEHLPVQAENPDVNDDEYFPENLDDQAENPNPNDDDEYFDDAAEDDGEIETIQRHVKYQDTARDALLKLAAELLKGKNVTNAFLKVIDGFEKGIAEFHSALRRRTVRLDNFEDLKDFIKEAAKDRTTNTKILRALASQGLFLAERLEEDLKRTKRSDFLKLGASEFLNTIKNEIGEETFEDILSVRGLVTLIFVIDDTGSMGGEIAAAVAISKQIVNANRDYDVDFVLSPFNDPDTGPLTRKSQLEGDSFVTAVEALRAHHGGDCPELAFTGMKNALEEGGPQPGSSMFVFTDAGPKDAELKDEVIDLAEDLEGIKINFFTTGSCLGKSDAQVYNDVARETGGRVFRLHKTIDLKKLGESVSASLQGEVPIISGSGGPGSGRRRRTTDMEYIISVDESIEELSIVVTTQNSGAGIRVVNPTGNDVTVGRVPLSKGVVYNINNQITGRYKLLVPTYEGNHTYRVNGVSKSNVDFGHYYVYIAKRGTRIPTPLDQPLQGFPAKTFITIAGAKFVKPRSLRIQVVDDSNKVLADKPLTAVGISGVRYFVKFGLPSGPFQLQLHGETVNGNPFIRVSSSEDQAVPVLLKLSYKEDSNILHRGQNTRIKVAIYRGYIGAYCEKYTLSLTDKRGYGSIMRQPPRCVFRGRRGFATLEFNVPNDAPAATTEKVKVSLSRVGEEKTILVSLTMSFLLV